MGNSRDDANNNENIGLCIVGLSTWLINGHTRDFLKSLTVSESTRVAS
jgi:hypothetical protein